MVSTDASRPAVFLDRDGTLIHDDGYLADPARVRLLPGAADALIALADAGFARVVITNQSGIGRGMYTRTDFEATQREMERQLRNAGASIDATYHCPHTPDAGCPCRKPGSALYREAIATLNLDPSTSWCVGDKLRDIEPSLELACRAMLVQTGPAPLDVDGARRLNAEIVDDLLAGSVVIRRYLSGL